MPDLDDLVRRLDAIAEELGELGMSVLRDAIEGGAAVRPELERRISRARTAVEKARHLLDTGSGVPER